MAQRTEEKCYCKIVIACEQAVGRSVHIFLHTKIFHSPNEQRNDNI